MSDTTFQERLAVARRTNLYANEIIRRTEEYVLEKLDQGWTEGDFYKMLRAGVTLPPVDEPPAKKLYKTTIKIEVLSEGVYDPETLAEVHEDTTAGDCSADWTIESMVELTPEEMAKALNEQGSCEDFFSVAREVEYDTGR